MPRTSRKKTHSRLIDEAVIRARCQNELKERVVGFAEANNVTESDFVREAVEQYLAHLESGGQRHMVNPFAASGKKR